MHGTLNSGSKQSDFGPTVKMDRRKTGDVNKSSGNKPQGDQVSRVDHISTKIEKVSISDIKKLPKFQYSRDELLSFKHLPACQVRPSTLDPAYNNGHGLWDPERWHYGRRRSETPTDDDGRPNRSEETYKRRSGDPRERVRKEQDGIILSPQRRSFNSGCHVDAKSNRRPESPLNREMTGYRDATTRRIGSGRILSRDVWEKNVEPQAEYFKRGTSNKERHDRRHCGQEYERDREKEHRRGEKNRFSGSDRRRCDKEEVPEWVSGGPTTQDEQIELHGFEEDQPEDSEKPLEESTIFSQPGVETEAEEEHLIVENQLEVSHPASPVSSQNELQDSGTNADFLDDILKLDMLNYPDLLSNELMTENSSGSRFSQWFKRESPAFEVSQSRRSSLQDELMPEMPEPNISILPTSESDAYFAPISPAPAATSEYSRMHIKPTLLLEMLQRGVGTDGGRAPSIKDLEAAGKVHSVEELEAKMRQNSQSCNQQNHIQQIPAKHVDEDLVVFNNLLSRVSEGLVTTARGPNGHQAPDVDYLQMLGKSRQEHAAWAAESQFSSQPIRPIVPQQPVKLMQQAQQQDHNQDLVSSLLGAASVPGQPQYLAPPGPSISPVAPDMSMFDSTHPSRDLLRRPEAVAIIQGLQNGQLTVKHLVHQLQNTALQLRHRDLLFSILKLYLTLGPDSFPRSSPLPGPPLPEAMLLHQILAQRPGQQQLRVPSPIGGGYCHPPPIMSPNITPSTNTLTVQHSGLPHRVPSPRELVVHTQNIMQSALIKKKLEEQLENFRKRQEMQQSVSPNVTSVNTGASGKGSTSPAKHLSPTPLAFTPTSVLRKMTAEKEPDILSSARTDEQSKLQHLQTAHLQNTHQQQRQQPHQLSNSVNPWGIPKPPGRAIVKGNASYHFNPNLEYHKQKHQQSLSAQQQLVLQQQQRLAASFGGGCSKLNHSSLTAVQPQQINSLIMMHRTNPRGHSIATYQNHHHHQHQQRHSPSLQQYLINQSLTNSGMQQQPPPTLPLPAHRVGNSSPTSDQLARWFSPELLVQAHAGQLLDMPPIPSASSILSLEELERLQQAAATAVHN